MTSYECARFNGCHVTVRQIMTQNIIISSTFVEVSHAIKKEILREHVRAIYCES